MAHLILLNRVKQILAPHFTDEETEVHHGEYTRQQCTINQAELEFESLALIVRAFCTTACVPQPEGKALPNCGYWLGASLCCSLDYHAWVGVRNRLHTDLEHYWLQASSLWKRKGLRG